MKITAYEQLNFSKVGSFSGEKKNPPALPVVDEDLARKMYVTNSFRV